MPPVNDLIKRILPASLYPVIRDLPYTLKDRGPQGLDEAMDIPIPKLRDQFDGERGYAVFDKNGREAFEFYRSVLGIRPDWKVLDLGSGIGRKTRPLVRFINDEGLYVGLDIDERGIKWCSNNLSPINPRLVFFRLNVYNSFYNPSGKIKADNIVLPFADNGFDMTVLWSVFTHMHEADIARYLVEISRILKPGGKIASSFLILNDQSKERIASGNTKLRLTHPLPGGHSCTNNPNVPEDAIAVDEDWLRQTYISAGLVIREPIMFGAWSGNRIDQKYSNLNYQDIVVAERPLVD